MRQPQEGNCQRRNRFRTCLSRCELRLEVWLGPSITRTSDFHYFHCCFCSAEVCIFCSIRGLWEDLLMKGPRVSLQPFRFLYFWLSCLFGRFYWTPVSGMDTPERMDAQIFFPSRKEQTFRPRYRLYHYCKASLYMIGEVLSLVHRTEFTRSITLRRQFS